MKAAYLTGHGGVDKFVYGDLPDPVAGPGEVVVDVHAASVNAENSAHHNSKRSLLAVRFIGVNCARRRTKRQSK